MRANQSHSIHQQDIETEPDPCHDTPHHANLNVNRSVRCRSRRVAFKSLRLALSASFTERAKAIVQASIALTSAPEAFDAANIPALKDAV